ncbi:DUF58 domain-containing protein [Uliginosibacterium sp. H3]|uniref:DUF58 domain-containing protein n=1 Tax=Uliginosibacterium silvisoli TaxID=3114758 RepID=A0ABU6K986_9RHOO|nr:DUF58 domain-containing protein [Uliginosibacterium sp. H3]
MSGSQKWIRQAMAALRQRSRCWMQRVSGPEAQPIVLPQRRVYVLPSMAGLGVVLVLAVMLLASVNYNLSLGYAFTFLIAGTGVAHILATWRNLVGLSLSFQAGSECFAGEAAAFRLVLGSANKHVRHAIQIRSDDGTPLLMIDTADSDSRYGQLEIPALRRGRMLPGRLTIETVFPLGWVRAWSYVLPDVPLLVYPQPLGDLPLPLASGSDAHGTQRARLFADEEFAGLRDYRAADPPSRIAWRRAARDGSLLVKQFDALDAEDWLLSWSHLPAALDTEARLSQLTQWLLQARAANARVTLEVPGARLGPDHGDAHYQACLQHLALFGGNA